MDSLIIVILVVAALGLAMLIIIKRMKRHADRVNDYFVNAVLAYAFFGDEDAKVAAVAAGKVADTVQRNSMVVALRRGVPEMTSDVSKHPELETVIRKVSEIEAEISAKDWTIQDIVHEKQRLHESNPEYLKALNKADPNVFVRKYGDLFRF